MSKDVEGDAEKLHIIEHKSNDEEEEEEEEEEEDDGNDDQNMKMLAMEDLVPITQTLITPSLARLFNLNVQPQQQQQQQFLEGIRPTERSYGALSNEELQHMQLQEDYHSSKAELEDDSKLSADDPCLQIMMGAFVDRNIGAPAGSYKRSQLNAGLECYNMQLGNDGIDDHAEDYGMNHLIERENSSNSGDAAGSGGGGGGGGGARTLKRPRLVWTPQLHKRFVDAVSHLGIKNAVPKTIMQLMNVDGLTRENVASHLQKYRLYLRRVQQGNLFSSCVNSPNKSILGGLDHHHLIGSPLSPAASSDHLFSSSSIPPTNMGSNNHMHHHHRTPAHINPVIPSHMQSLLLQQPQHQINQAIAMIKSPPFTNQHLNPQRYSSNAVNSSSPMQRSSWPSPHSSIMDINSLHHVESNGSAGSSSPPRRALTLFPH